MRMRWRKTVTFEFDDEIELPPEVQMDLDAGLGLEGLSEEGRAALVERLLTVDNESARDAETDALVVLRRGTDSPMLSDLHLN